MTSRLPNALAEIVADPRAYAEWSGLHEALARIRREHPFARATLDGYNPFWVASRHADIRAVAQNNRVFLSGLGSLQPMEALEAQAKSGALGTFRSIVAMNEPDHARYRQLTFDWFKPRSMARFEPKIRQLARRFTERLSDVGGECDFVREVGVHYPLLVIMSILGVPEEDEALLLRWTQHFFGGADEALNYSGRAETIDDTASSMGCAVAEAMDYFGAISAERRRRPQNDLISVVANSRIDGEAIPDADAMGYYITAAFAGHDTTASSIAGGLWALAERPVQFERVRSDPSRIPALVEESVRWTSPIHQFVRIAAEDAEIAGQTVHKGDWVVLCFPSGNRDETVFERPFEFSIERGANRHVGFGHGPHLCLGIHLARCGARTPQIPA